MHSFQGRNIWGGSRVVRVSRWLLLSKFWVGWGKNLAVIVAANTVIVVIVVVVIIFFK